ncbi:MULTISPECIES: hypothetical protein [Streptomyces]|uniref:hypothetical protein n=1 Tax=Streptomyces TaxID=1883 RepID=UPI00344EF4D6
MSAITEADLRVTEDTGHRLLGRDVIHPTTGRLGTVGAVLIYVSKLTDRPVSKVAHVRPMDRSGREWTADPDTLQPIIRSSQPMGTTG